MGKAHGTTALDRCPAQIIAISGGRVSRRTGLYVPHRIGWRATKDRSRAAPLDRDRTFSERSRPPAQPARLTRAGLLPALVACPSVLPRPAGRRVVTAPAHGRSAG